MEPSEHPEDPARQCGCCGGEILPNSSLDIGRTCATCGLVLCLACALSHRHPGSRLPAPPALPIRKKTKKLVRDDDRQTQFHFAPEVKRARRRRRGVQILDNIQKKLKKFLSPQEAQQTSMGIFPDTDLAALVETAPWLN